MTYYLSGYGSYGTIQNYSLGVLQCNSALLERAGFSVRIMIQVVMVKVNARNLMQVFAGKMILKGYPAKILILPDIVR